MRLDVKICRCSVEPLGSAADDFGGAAEETSAFPADVSYSHAAIDDIHSAALRAGGSHNGGLVRGEQWLDNPPSDCVDISPTQTDGPHSRGSKRL